MVVLDVFLETGFEHIVEDFVLLTVPVDFIVCVEVRIIEVRGLVVVLDNVPEVLRDEVVDEPTGLFRSVEMI